MKIPTTDGHGAADAAATGARVCDPQQLRQSDLIRNWCDIPTRLRLTEPRSEIFGEPALRFIIALRMNFICLRVPPCPSVV